MKSNTQISERVASVAAEKDAALKPCNPSVCVGDAQPTSCFCPTTQQK